MFDADGFAAAVFDAECSSQTCERPVNGPQYSDSPPGSQRDSSGEINCQSNGGRCRISLIKSPFLVDQASYRHSDLSMALCDDDQCDHLGCKAVRDLQSMAKIDCEMAAASRQHDASTVYCLLPLCDQSLDFVNAQLAQQSVERSILEHVGSCHPWLFEVVDEWSKSERAVVDKFLLKVERWHDSSKDYRGRPKSDLALTQAERYLFYHSDVIEPQGHLSDDFQFSSLPQYANDYPPSVELRHQLPLLQPGSLQTVHHTRLDPPSVGLVHHADWCPPSVEVHAGGLESPPSVSMPHHGLLESSPNASQRDFNPQWGIIR